MFSRLFALFCFGSSTLSAGALPAQDILFEDAAPAAPNFRLSFTAYIDFDLANSHPIATADGTQLNVQITGGNWTAPNGDLLATIVPGIGGEHGYIDSKKVLQVDGRYAVEFIDDQKYASVQVKGTGTAGRSNQAYATIRTDSAKNQAITRQKLYAPGKFVGNTLVAPHWSAVVFA